MTVSHYRTHGVKIMQNKKLERKRAMEELTRKDILESAIELLLEKGITKFTMDRVASGAGIAKGTVYLYYKDKKVLLDSVVDYYFKPLEQDYKNISESDSDPLLRLEQIVRVSLEYVDKNMPLFKEVRNVIFTTSDQYIGDENSWYWTTIDQFAAILEDGARTGQLRKIKSKKIAALFLDSINSLMAHRILSQVEETIDEDVKELMDLYVSGLKK